MDLVDTKFLHEVHMLVLDKILRVFPGSEVVYTRSLIPTKKSATKQRELFDTIKKREK